MCVWERNKTMRARMQMSSFRPPSFQMPSRGSNEGAPASPPRMGFVAGAEGQGGMHGYVGGKPPVKEEPQTRSTRTRQPLNLASPDPALAQSAFTQSQYTQPLISASANSVAERETENPIDARREGLRRFKASGGGGLGGSAGRSCVRPTPGLRNMINQPGLSRNGQTSNGGNMTTFLSTAQTTQESKTSDATFATYTLTDPGLAYKSFSGSGWFRVAQIIIPSGKKVKKVYISSMLVTEGSDMSSTSVATNEYSLRLVNPSETPNKTLWAEYSATNTDKFMVYEAEIASHTVTGSLIEVQVQQGSEFPVLVSTILVEFQ